MNQKKVWIELIDKYCNYRTMNIYYSTTHALSTQISTDTFSESLSVLVSWHFPKGWTGQHGIRWSSSLVSQAPSQVATSEASGVGPV